MPNPALRLPDGPHKKSATPNPPFVVTGDCVGVTGAGGGGRVDGGGGKLDAGGGGGGKLDAGDSGGVDVTGGGVCRESGFR
jgi:hypothetical protein